MSSAYVLIYAVAIYSRCKIPSCIYIACYVFCAGCHSECHCWYELAMHHDVSSSCCLVLLRLFSSVVLVLVYV